MVVADGALDVFGEGGGVVVVARSACRWVAKRSALGSVGWLFMAARG